MKCFIFGAGEYDSDENMRAMLERYGLMQGGAFEAAESAQEEGSDRLVIAADAGLERALHYGVNPDIVLGDFDSLSFDLDNIPEKYGAKTENWEVVRYPAVKDDTDMMLAVKKGFKRGCDEFYIFGGMGGRVEHTIANIQTMSYIVENGGRCFVHGANENVGILVEDELVFPSHFRGRVSVFSLSDVSEGVNLEGFKYELKDYSLSRRFPLGVSNEFAGREASISVAKGELLIVWDKQL